jgi:uncharacterized alkaline shock family protein YloU
MPPEPARQEYPKALLLVEFFDPEGIVPTGDPDEIDELVAQSIAGDAADLVMGHWRVKASVVERLSTFTLGELQLLHLGLAVIGDQARVDHALVGAWGELVGEIAAAVREKVRREGTATS